MKGLVLPNAANPVPVKRPVSADYRNTFHQGLTYKQTVEWILVVEIKPGKWRDMIWKDGEKLKGIDVQLLFNEIFKRVSQVVFAQADFDGNFPDASRADKYLICGAFNKALRGWGKL